MKFRITASRVKVTINITALPPLGTNNVAPTAKVPPAIVAIIEVLFQSIPIKAVPPLGLVEYSAILESTIIANQSKKANKKYFCPKMGHLLSYLRLDFL